MGIIVEELKEEIKQLKRDMEARVDQSDDLLADEVYNLSQKLDEKILAYYKEEIRG